MNHCSFCDFKTSKITTSCNTSICIECGRSEKNLMISPGNPTIGHVCLALPVIHVRNVLQSYSITPCHRTGKITII